MQPILAQDDEKQKADYMKALQFGKVLVAYARVMLIGPGGVGKSSFLLGLENKLLGAATSTQLAEMSTFKLSGSQQASLLSWSKASGSPESPWMEVTEDDETNEIVGLIQLVANATKGQKSSSRFVEIFQSSTNLQPKLVSQGSAANTYQSEVMKTVEEILSRAIQQAKQYPYVQAQESEVMMHVWDCGGQPVFLDVLPPFLTSRSMFLLMFDASKKLQDKCVATSHQKGQILKEEVYRDLTTIELMLQWMASIHANLAIRYVKVNSDPCILPIGTHGDDPSVESKKEEILRELSSQCEQKAFSYLLQRGVIVDNTTAGMGEDEDPVFKEVRTNVYNFAENNLKVATPITWVLFRKIFKKVAVNHPIISLKKATAIGQACGIPEESFLSVLKFYHELAVFFHYAHIPSLKHHVIADPRWLIHHLGKILALEGFEEMKGSPLWKPLRDKGILLEPLYKAVWKGCGLPPESLIHLLDHFMLLSPISTKVCSFPGQEYFIPAVLKQFNPDQDHNVMVPATTIFTAAPLHLLFNTLQVPPGFFTRLATSLAKNENTHVVFDQGVYRNRITILYGKAHSKIDKVVITQLSSSIQVEVTRVHHRQSHDPFFTTVCREVLKLIEECSASILEWLPGIMVTPAFACEQCKTQPKHFVKFKSSATTLSLLHCEKLQIVVLNQSQHFWLKISPKEEGLCGNPPSNFELLQLVKEIPSYATQDLVEKLEMTAYRQPKDHNSLHVLLTRFTRDMGEQELHTQSHLVHHLRSIGLPDIADKLKYQEFCTTAEDTSPHESGSSLTLRLTQLPLTTTDLADCSKLIGGQNFGFLASMLDVSDAELDGICSRHKNPQARAYHVLNLWYKRSTSDNKRQNLLDALENANFFEATRRLKAKNKKPSLPELLKHVDTAKWHRLGVFLGIGVSKLDALRRDTSDSEDALSRVFEMWLQTERQPTWKKVVQALNNLELHVLATEIEDRFC